MKRPRVVIPEIYQNVDNYTKAMYAAGMDPVVVSVQSVQVVDSIQQEFMDYHEFSPASCDGLLLPGGGDINPESYGESNHGSMPVDEWVDDLQFRMLKDFVRCKKPILGICRGLQLINVWFGGSLIQDLEDASVHRSKPAAGDLVHDCRAEKGCWLAKLYGESFPHNSNHHQAVCRLGEGLTVDSRCPFDDVIEAFHHATLPIFAVQWHPERMCLAHERSDTVNGLEIFRFFCRVCGGSSGHSDPYRDDPFRRDGIVSDGLGL